MSNETKSTEGATKKVGGITVRYDKRGRWTKASLRAISQAEKQMGEWEAAGFTVDSPLFSLSEYSGVDPSEMTIWMGHFDDSVSEDDPDKELALLLYRRLLAFNEALAAFAGRKQIAKDEETLKALAHALTETGDYLSSIALDVRDLATRQPDDVVPATATPTGPNVH